MPKKDTYYFDTINAIRIYDNYIGDINTSPNHSYNVYFPLKLTIKNIKSISLKSVNMPLYLYNIRIESKLHKLGFTYTKDTFVNVHINCNISASAYASEASLISAINTSINTALSGTPGVTITLTTTTIYGRIFANINNNCSAIAIDRTSLSEYILGFTNQWSETISNFTAQSPINLNAYDTHLFMTFPNIPNNSFNNTFTGFMLPLNNTITNNTLNINESQELQTININRGIDLDKLNVVITDRLLNPLTGYFNYSFSLIVEYYEEEDKQQFLNFNN
jgi:hypothetical protein